MISFLGRAIRLKHHPENVPIMTSGAQGDMQWTTDRYARTALVFSCRPSVLALPSGFYAAPPCGSMSLSLRET